MDILTGCAANIASNLVCGVVKVLRYPCCFNKFVEDLKKEEADLNATRNSVQDRVAHDKKQLIKNDELIHKWLEDADKDIKDVNGLLNKAIRKKSCFGHCPNWISRCYYAIQLENEKKELEELIKEGKSYVKLERAATLPPQTKYFPSDKYLNFESRESAYKQVIEAVIDKKVNMIGLYGMGGCGKTTLAEEVMKIAEDERLFDKVVLVAVSSIVQVRGIQEKIASSIQFKFPVNEENERARVLCERLSQEKKILVILDDVWQILDFGAIGIPLTEHHKGCKVLITTRSEDVCTLMDCQKKIQLQILTNDEAWILFQKQAHISEDTSDAVKRLAREISNECKGLPVAISAVAGSLKGKAEVNWDTALTRLRNSKPMHIERGLRDPYKCLQLSYDNLDTEEAKSLLMLCSVFPEDAEIPIWDLIRLAIGLGLVGEVRSYDEARKEVIAAKIKLLSSCLLMLDADYDDHECVKMHDLVRGVAHFIAKNENKIIKCQLENEVTLEQCSIRYLWCKEFPNDLDCSNLEFLCIATELEILGENFKRMGKLRVLFLTNDGDDDNRPLSTMLFKTLTNLRCLILKRWKLSDISFLTAVRKLQSLSLYECSLPSFSDLQTDDLTNLKLLELVECEMERNSYNVIGRIPQIEELRIIDDNEEWDHWSTIEFFKTMSVLQALQYYVIILGDLFYGEKEDENVTFSRERILSLSCFDISNEAIMSLAKRAKVVGMGNMKGGAKNIIPHIFQMKEARMNKLEISNSKEIECLVDTTNIDHSSEVGTLFSELLQLTIIKMNNLRVLCNDYQPPCATFQKLEELYVEHCPELTSLFMAGPFTLSKLTDIVLQLCPKLSSLFTISTAKTLTSLKKLYISECGGLKHIIAPETGHKNEKEDIVEDGHDLQSVISLFPTLKTLYIRKCAKLEVIFPLSRIPELKSIKISECDELKEIMEQEWEEDNNLSNHLSLQPAFPKLTFLEIEYCRKLTSLFTSSPALQSIYIKKCKELRQIIGQDLEEDKNLSNLHSLQPRFPKLTKLVVEECHKLKRVLSTFASDDLSNLEILVINRADELEELIGCEHGKGHLLAEVELPKLKLLIFIDLSNLRRQGIELLAVKHRIVHNCPNLALTSTTTLQQLYDNFPDSDFENAQLSSWELRHMIGQIKESDEVLKSRDTIELPLLQISEESEEEFVEKAEGSEVEATTTSTNIESVDQESSSEAGFPDQHAVEDTINIQEIIKESIQEVPVSKGPTNKTLSTGIEGINMSGVVATHTCGCDILAQGSQVFEIDNKLNESKTVTCTRLAEYKRFVDLDDTQIALLAEAIAAYPHLWNSCQKSREQFQAWMLKTLADMLLFLRNESANGVTPQREKEFHKLCDEAIKLGFDSSWVDEMRQNVVARDPKLEEDRAQSQVNELFERSTGADMVPDSQVVEQGDVTDEDCIGTSQCQKIQNVDISIKEGSNLLTDKEGEIGVVPNDCIVTMRNKVTKEFELVERQSKSQPSLMDHHKSLEEISEIRRS